MCQFITFYPHPRHIQFLMDFYGLFFYIARRIDRNIINEFFKSPTNTDLTHAIYQDYNLIFHSKFNFQIDYDNKRELFIAKLHHKSKLYNCNYFK